MDRYLYVRNSPLNAYDLNGRDACAHAIGEAAGQAAEDVGNAGHDLWNLTRPGRHFIANRAEDFVKLAKKAASDFEASEDSLGETTEEFGSWSSKSIDCLWKTITEPSKHQRCLPELHEYKPDELEISSPRDKATASSRTMRARSLQPVSLPLIVLYFAWILNFIVRLFLFPHGGAGAWVCTGLFVILTLLLVGRSLLTLVHPADEGRLRSGLLWGL